MKNLFAGCLLILIPITASAQYIIYNETDGKIIGSTPYPALEKGQKALPHDGPQFDLRAKKIVNGAIVDVEEYGRKIVILGDTEILADGKDTALVTVILSDKSGNIIANRDRILKVKTGRGRLDKFEVTTINGIAVFEYGYMTETVENTIDVSDPSNEFARARVSIISMPATIEQDSDLAEAATAGAAAGAVAGAAAAVALAKKKKEETV